MLKNTIQYNTINDIEINNLKVRITLESNLAGILGVQDSFSTEIDYAGDGESINVYYYNNSNFKFWEGLFQSFLVKDSVYEFNSVFKVGDSVSLIESHYHDSYLNFLLRESATDFDKENFDFDKYYWLSVGGGDGVLIFSKQNIITGYRYSNGI